MAEVANAVFAADVMGWVRTPEHIRRDYASFTHFDASKDLAMAEVDGRLVGYVRTVQWIDEKGILVQGQVGFVHPAFRRRGWATSCCAGSRRGSAKWHSCKALRIPCTMCS